MRYFCSYNYLIDGRPYFGNVILKTEVDPYDDIEGFMSNGHKDLKMQAMKTGSAWRSSV